MDSRLLNTPEEGEKPLGDPQHPWVVWGCSGDLVPSSVPNLKLLVSSVPWSVHQSNKESTLCPPNCPGRAPIEHGGLGYSEGARETGLTTVIEMYGDLKASKSLVHGPLSPPGS